ncbi:MAG: hypothetical protein QNI84_16630 [Henriciella sp.]|nr:hypothetical protein [Henriciella sp.]
MIRSFISAAVAVGFTGVAFASGSFTATLETPITKADEIVAAKAIWTCEGDTCKADLSRKTATVRTCKQVVKEVGKVTAFASDNNTLSETDLEACNAAAKS